MSFELLGCLKLLGFQNFWTVHNFEMEAPASCSYLLNQHCIGNAVIIFVIVLVKTYYGLAVAVSHRPLALTSREQTRCVPSARDRLNAPRRTGPNSNFSTFLIGFLWPPHGWNRASHYIFVVWFLFSSPILSRRRLNTYHTSTHDVALVRMYSAGLKCAARGSLKYRTEKFAKNSPSGHHRTSLSGCIFATEATDNRKNLLNSNISPHAVSYTHLTLPTILRV